MKKLNLLVLIFLTIISCKDDDTNTVIDTTPKFGTLNLDFSNKIGANDIALNTTTYTNQSNEAYTISQLRYIISNIVLIKENGDEFVYPVADSYFLINEEVTGSKSITLSDINVEEYTKIKFGFGVDQSKYPIESGTANFIPTAEENDMLWNWAAGYKFLKFEGSFTPQGGTSENFLLHIGSLGVNQDNYKEIILDLPSMLVVSENASSNIGIQVDVDKIFDSTNTHSLTEKNEVTNDPDSSPKLAQNVSTMFSVTNVSN